MVSCAFWVAISYHLGLAAFLPESEVGLRVKLKFIGGRSSIWQL